MTTSRSSSSTVVELPRAGWYASPWPIRCVIGIAMLAWMALLGNPFERQEMRWLEHLLRSRYQFGLAPAADPHIVHLDIGERELEALSSIELEYATTATIIREVADLGAKAIVFDIVFARGTTNMVKPILEAIDYAKEHGCAVVLPEAVLPEFDKTRQQKRARSFPLRERYQPAGLINLKADSDGVVRHYPFVVRTAWGFEPSLALAAYLAWRDSTWEKAVRVQGTSRVQWDELSANDPTSLEPRTLPTHPVLLNFRCGWKGTGLAAFRHFTWDEIHDLYTKSKQDSNSGTPSPSPRPLHNVILFSSFVATGIADLGPTPFGESEPRVLLHSMALNDLIQWTWFRSHSGMSCVLAGLAVIAASASLQLSRRTVSLILIWLTGTALIVFVGVALLLKFRWVMPTIAAASVWTLFSVVELARREAFNWIENLKLSATMGLYFSPRVMKRVLEKPGWMEPQEAELTVLLSDLRNSTPIAERFGAKGTFDLLNRVFAAQTKAVMSEDGSLEHFLGDQFLSYWGAPDPQPDAADRAFRAALKLIEAMEALRRELPPEQAALFGYGVALHSGKALVGNKGSAQRLDYGLVGDLINSAARVESLTKHYGVLFLITREAHQRLTAPPLCRLLDRVIVKGKTEPLELLEPRHSFSPSNFEALCRSYDEAFRRYQAGEFTEAEKQFRRLAEEEGDDPSRVLAGRCDLLKKQEQKDWKGIYELTTK
jgi:class 3 adenylate cyclase/CHASE2 domain-containing sensor protein